MGKTRPSGRCTPGRTEHPHASGENCRSSATLQYRSGTSPREWGKRRAPADAAIIGRNIPTRVGKTCRPRWRLPRRPEHPHASGENLRFWRSTGSPFGTSSREWGKPNPLARRKNPGRNIPTRVGKTLYQKSVAVASAEHPHASGENMSRQMRQPTMPGTSPREWGKRRVANKINQYIWNIPTRVGKTPCMSGTCNSRTEHPHASGENLNGVGWEQYVNGTSPREWGKLLLRRSDAWTPRNIPTRVGKTRRRGTSRTRRTEHPHASGENSHLCCKAWLHPGTSPREWGKRGAGALLPHRPRNIPTRVGKTVRRPRWTGRGPEHPHASGENI